ncbi:MAG: prepilin peptidase [Actinomycetota bacterium]|nr:prepilin peptidase [Actinomycetota bacterium]
MNDLWWLRALVALPFGLGLGSFMTVAISRMPKGESVVKPRSRCPACGTEILARDNIPVVSWVLLGGKCRACGEPISPMYPLTELATALLVVAAAIRFQNGWQIVLIGALLSMMPAVAIIDVRHRIIPNRLMYPSLIAFPVFVALGWLLGAPLDVARAAIGLLAFGGTLLLVAIASRGMGMGDVKLAGVIGVALGAIGLRFVGVAAFAAIGLGGIGSLIALGLGKGRKSAIPFGPYLAAGAVVAALWGQHIADWYLRTFVPR